MQVNPTGTPQIASTTVGSAPRVAGKSADGAAPPAAESGSFAPSADLAALLAAVRKAPDVRADAVATASANLASGALDTPEAAADTAKSFLNSGDASAQ